MIASSLQSIRFIRKRCSLAIIVAVLLGPDLASAQIVAADSADDFAWLYALINIE